jgi:hypothetical protein
MNPMNRARRSALLVVVAVALMSPAVLGDGAGIASQPQPGQDDDWGWGHPGHALQAIPIATPEYSYDPRADTQLDRDNMGRLICLETSAPSLDEPKVLPVRLPPAGSNAATGDGTIPGWMPRDSELSANRPAPGIQVCHDPWMPKAGASATE